MNNETNRWTCPGFLTQANVSIDWLIHLTTRMKLAYMHRNDQNSTCGHFLTTNLKFLWAVSYSTTNFGGASAKICKCLHEKEQTIHWHRKTAILLTYLLTYSSTMNNETNRWMCLVFWHKQMLVWIASLNWLNPRCTLSQWERNRQLTYTTDSTNHVWLLTSLLPLLMWLSLSPSSTPARIVQLHAVRMSESSSSSCVSSWSCSYCSSADSSSASLMSSPWLSLRCSFMMSQLACDDVPTTRWLLYSS